MVTFKHFLLELSRKHIFQLRQEMDRVFAAHAPSELAILNLDDQRSLSSKL